ncbi:hypothetical protein DIE19_13415 [Burkholderia sp. Bp9126]|nr:hypothetical protein DIE19_13415 [Burkholderia sp. Bp9126]
MNFLVNWLIALAALLAASLFLCLRTPHTRHPADIGRQRRVDSARLMSQAILGFWTAALVVVRGILISDGDDMSPAGCAAIALAALGLVSVAAYWSVCALRLRRPRTLFTQG